MALPPSLARFCDTRISSKNNNDDDDNDDDTSKSNLPGGWIQDIFTENLPLVPSLCRVRFMFSLGMARNLSLEILKQGLCWSYLRQVSVFSKNKDISNTNIGNNKNGFILELETTFAIPLGDFFALSLFFYVQDFYAQANRQTKIGERGGKQYVISWNNLVYLVFSGNVSSTYYRDCIIFTLRELTDFFNCITWSVYEKELQSIFHQNDVPAIKQNCIFPQERECKTVLDSGFQLLHSSLCKWNSNSRLHSFGILDSLSFISHSKAQDFGFLKLFLPDSIFHKQALPTVQVL